MCILSGTYVWCVHITGFNRLGLFVLLGAVSSYDLKTVWNEIRNPDYACINNLETI